MNVTIRLARTSDRESYPWRYFTINRETGKHTYYRDEATGKKWGHRPWVVTVDGALYVVSEGDRIVFQNGSEAVPDLVRMLRRLRDGTLDALYRDAQQRRRDVADRKFEENMEFIRNAGRGQA